MAKHADASQAKLSRLIWVKRFFGSRAHTDKDSSASLSEVASDDTTTEAPPASEAPVDRVPAEEVEECDARAGDDGDPGPEGAAPVKKFRSPVALATTLGLVMVVALTGLAAWFGFRTYQAHQAAQQRQLLIQVARQGAINLTTIDWQHADADIQRILDSASGAFYDDFANRSKPFIDVVKKAQSKSVGTITDAGLESQSGDEAQVLVAVSVKTSNLGAAEQDPRHWRMRITVKKVGNEAKVSNVAFVP